MQLCLIWRIIMSFLAADVVPVTFVDGGAGINVRKSIKTHAGLDNAAIKIMELYTINALVAAL